MGKWLSTLIEGMLAIIAAIAAVVLLVCVVGLIWCALSDQVNYDLVEIKTGETLKHQVTVQITNSNMMRFETFEGDTSLWYYYPSGTRASTCVCRLIDEAILRYRLCD